MQLSPEVLEYLQRLSEGAHGGHGGGGGGTSAVKAYVKTGMHGASSAIAPEVKAYLSQKYGDGADPELAAAQRSDRLGQIARSTGQALHDSASLLTGAPRVSLGAYERGNVRDLVERRTAAAAQTDAERAGERFDRERAQWAMQDEQHEYERSRRPVKEEAEDLGLAKARQGLEAGAQDLEAGKLELSGKQAAAKQAAVMRDPESPPSRLLKGWLAKVVPSLDTTGLSAADLGPHLALFERQASAEEKRAMDAAIAQARNEALVAKVDAASARAALSHNDRNAAREDAQQFRADQRAEIDVQKLGKDLDPIAQQRNDLATLRKAAQTDDIPGFGQGAGRLPDWATSKEGIETRQSALRIMAAIMKMTSGAAVSEQEAARLLESRGLGKTASVQSFKTGVSALEREFLDAVKRTEAKYRPEVVQTYADRGGFTSRALATEKPPAGKATRKFTRGPDGKLVEVR